MKTLAEKVAKLKAWCEDNYNHGADTMVECWEAADYEQLLTQCGGSPRAALRDLKSLAAIFREQQADARFHRQQAGA